ncbi:MAG TPA: aspartate aminotransferase family protein [Bryobacteraceae bacterium]|nr:aspartate aminotransferase family protein [Bryobacteraceae bacterium]
MATTPDVENRESRGGHFDAAEREQSVRSKTAGSRSRFERSRASLAGGVSTGLRRSAHPYPLFFSRGEGSQIVDVDENPYLDYTLAWGPLILGHNPPEVTRAIGRQLANGTTFGAQHDLEYEVAERLIEAIPCADLVCYANSGTEIVQVALRLARAVTGRTQYLKFEGHYHGWDDSVLLSYHPSLEEIERAQGRAVPTGAGQRPDGGAVIAEWNNRESVEQAFAAHGAELSAVICEPLLANSGSIPPAPGFLEFLRQVTSENGALLIFDEVITGFRLAYGGAQERYGITPDLATFAKAVGAGTPLSALAGQRRYMDAIASGRVVHAGTLNGNPLSLAAAKAGLDVLRSKGAAGYEHLRRRAETLREGLERILRSHGFTVCTCGDGPVFTLSFAAAPPHNYRDTLAALRDLYRDFALALLDEGVLVLPDGRWYVSFAHSDSDIDQTLAAVSRAAH